MSEWIFNKLKPYALRFREWSKGDELWVQIPLWIFIAWMMGFLTHIGAYILYVGLTNDY